MRGASGARLVLYSSERQQRTQRVTPNVVVLPNIAGGNHVVNLVALTGTSTDANDWFNVTVLELPF